MTKKIAKLFSFMQIYWQGPYEQFYKMIHKERKTQKNVKTLEVSSNLSSVISKIRQQQNNHHLNMVALSSCKREKHFVELNSQCLYFQPHLSEVEIGILNDH